MAGEDTRSSPYDVVVVGAGPAGISAAINVANRKRTVAVFDSQEPFSYTRRAPHVPNYPGFSYATGEELAAAFTGHLDRLGVPVFRQKITRVARDEDGLQVLTETDLYYARAVVLATGVYREAELEGEAELIGRGVSYCANCDGRLFSGRDVAFISYAPAGEEEAAVLAEDLHCKVTFVPLYPDEPRLPPSVRVLPHERPESLYRDVDKVHVRMRREELAVDGVFIYRRSVSPQDLVDGLELEDGHVRVGRRMETGIPGVYAAGDCTGEPYQIAKAVGEGQVAALQALGYIRERRVPAPEEPPALKTEDREALARILRDRLQRPVRLIHFTQVPGSDGSPVGPECGTCRETRRLLEEFSALSPSLTLEIHDLARDAELAERLGVARIPATLVGLDEEDSPRHRFYGQPSGYEFGPFLDCVLETSARMVRVEESTATALRGLSRPVRVEVLTTPTCPRCPEAARLAQRFAAGSPDVVADVVAVTEFPEVAQLYRVQAVPLVVVDGRPAPPGPLGEASLLALVLAAGSRAAADAPATVEAHADAADHRSVGE